MATVATPPVESPEAANQPAGASFLWRAAMVVGVLLAAHLPLLYVHAQQLWLRPHYQFFPVVLLGAVVLAVVRLSDAGPLTPGQPWLSYLLLGTAWATLFVAEGLYSSWLAAVAAQLLLLAIAFALGSGVLVLRLLPAWLLLWLTVPPPFKLDETLVLWLQTLTTHWSSAVLDLLGVWHVMAGNVVEVAGRHLLVEEACSGVSSLFSVVGCTLFFVFFMGRRPLHALCLLVAAVAWVMAANVARVVLITCAATHWGVNLLDGWRHDAVGFALFALALVLVWSTDRLLLFLGGSVPPANTQAPAPAAPTPVSFTGCERSWLTSRTVACLYGLLLVAHFALYGPWTDAGAPASGPVAAALPNLAATTLPARSGEWRQENYAKQSRNPGSAYGEFSRAWTYRRGRLRASFSLDYPFSEWHELTVCYVNQGWALGEELTHRIAAAGAEWMTCVEVRMSRPGHRSGHLLFGEFDDEGAPLQPRRTAAAAAVTRHVSALQRYWHRFTGDTAPLPRSGPVYQAQLFVETYAPLTWEEQVQLRHLFLDCVAALRRHWSQAPPRTTADVGR
jgi:exosortase